MVTRTSRFGVAINFSSIKSQTGLPLWRQSAPRNFLIASETCLTYRRLKAETRGRGAKHEHAETPRFSSAERHHESSPHPKTVVILRSDFARRRISSMLLRQDPKRRRRGRRDGRGGTLLDEILRSAQNDGGVSIAPGVLKQRIAIRTAPPPT